MSWLGVDRCGGMICDNVAWRILSVIVRTDCENELFSTDLARGCTYVCITARVQAHALVRVFVVILMIAVPCPHDLNLSCVAQA